MDMNKGTSTSSSSLDRQSQISLPDIVVCHQFREPTEGNKADVSNFVRSNMSENKIKPFVIGVAGGAASGKSAVCKKIVQQLGQMAVDGQTNRQRKVAVISQESFYKVPSEDEAHESSHRQYNFDHPGTYDVELSIETMNKVVCGQAVDIPAYDYKTNSRLPNNLTVYPSDVVLVEGIFLFYWPDLRNMFNMKLFVDTDPDTRLCRRVLKDTKEHGKDLNMVLQQYTDLVKPAFEEFCLPTKKYADVIIPRGADNTVAIDLIVQHIQEILQPTNHGIQRLQLISDSCIGRPH